MIEDYGTIDDDHRYARAVCTSIEKRILSGDPLASKTSSYTWSSGTIRM
jgi:hypothetical protein